MCFYSGQKFSLLYFIVLFFSCDFSYAQFPCGASVSKEQLQTLQKFYRESEFKKSITGDTFYVPVKVHIIRKSDGTGGLDTLKFRKELDTTNYFYKNAKIQFAVCGQINYINNDGYATFDAPGEEVALTESTEQPRVINIYFMDTLLLNNNHICGFSYLPMGPLRIYIDNACVNNGNTMAHELGHFFSLIHTHGTSNDTLTNELVNESNCTIAGDFICDTPADPNLSGKVSYNAFTKKCTYTGTIKDANGEFFKPMLQNIMSYSKPQCTDSFTLGQYQKIRNSLFYHGRTDLICSDEAVIAKNQITGVYPNPFQNSFIVFYQLTDKAQVTLTLYDMLGNEIVYLYNKTEEKGLLKLYYPFGNTFLNSGIYFLKMEVNGKPASVQKLVRIIE